MSGDTKKDLRAEAKSFSASLTNVFLMKRRDPQTKHLLEKAQSLIDALLADTARPAAVPPNPRSHQRSGAGMGQLWVKLDELKRENDDLKRHQRQRSTEEKAASPKSPKSPRAHVQLGQVEALCLDLQKLKAENELLKVQVEKLEGTIKEHQTISVTLQDEAKRSKIALEAAQRLARKAREDAKKLEASLSAAKAENDSLRKKSNQASNAAHSASSNSSVASSPPTPPPKPSSLSGSGSPKPVPRPRNDNRFTENIGEKCRPSNIALAYTTLESQEWMDAKESLEDGAEEEDVLKFLLNILMSTYDASNIVLQSVEDVIGRVLTNPTSALNMIASGESEDHHSLPEDVSDIVCQRLRANYDKINTEDIVELAQKNNGTSFDMCQHWTQPSVQRYAMECCALAWQMVIQKPPMRMLTTDTSFNPDRHRLWWSCNQSKARGVDYFIWPCLLDYDNGNLLVKGCVHAS